MPREGLRWDYATRLNGFRLGDWAGRNRVTVLDLVERAAGVPGLSAVDFNYPDHLEGVAPRELRARLDGLGVGLNGFAMRYGGVAEFRAGALAHADEGVRGRAVELTLRGIDALREAGGTTLTVWPGQDGWEHAFGQDWGRQWDAFARSLGRIAAHDPGVDVSVEYKPDEPRARALLPDAATTLLMIGEVGAGNLGVTLDFAHVLYAGESPTRAARMVARRSRLLGVHLNDGYGRRDDGLTTGSVHPVLTVELLWTLRRLGYEGALYFDTFPDAAGLDPVGELAANIDAVERLMGVVDRLEGDPMLIEAQGRGDALGAMAAVRRAMFP